jgi:hypothetical protein
VHPRFWQCVARLLVLAGTLPVEPPHFQGWDDVINNALKLGRFFFGIPLVVFGIQHFMYGRFVATLVPSWIPGRLFWAYFVGVAFVAAAVSIATKKQAHWAATLLGIMFFLWVLLLHFPRVAAAPHNGDEWTSAFVALAMSGGAWMVAGTLPKEDTRIFSNSNRQSQFPNAHGCRIILRLQYASRGTYSRIAWQPGTKLCSSQKRMASCTLLL